VLDIVIVFTEFPAILADDTGMVSDPTGLDCIVGQR